MPASSPAKGHASIFSRADLLFGSLLALISTGMSYRFAVGNQLEQLPIILQELDPSYLVNDFFLSTTREFGPRIYFVKLVAVLCAALPLPWAYALLNVLSDFALVLVTLWVARSFFESDRLTSFVTCVWTLGLSSFHLGDSTQIRYEILQPASIAIPGALWALGLGLHGRAVSAALVAGLASLSHPLYGMLSGAIALATAFVALLLPGGSNAATGMRAALRVHPTWQRACARVIPAGLLLGALLAVFWLLPYASVVRAASLSNGEFVEILARFRAPHHYLPSHFRLTDYFCTAGFLAATLVAYRAWAPTTVARTRILFLIPVASVLLGCVLSVIFSELWPLRSILTLQLFRLLSFVKWFGFLLLAKVLMGHWHAPAHLMVRPLVALSLIASGLVHPTITLIVLLLLRLRPSRNVAMLLFGATALATVLLWIDLRPTAELAYLGVAFAMLVLWEWKPATGQWLAAGFTCALLLFLSQNRGAHPRVRISALVPVFDLHDQLDEKAEAARAVKAHTNPSAVLLAPPEFGLLRLVGERALVVDFKSVPLQDAAMREWYRRMREVYGPTEGGGAGATQEMDTAYRGIADARLQRLSRRFGATHALLYAETATTLPVLFENGDYRLVRLASADSALR